MSSIPAFNLTGGEAGNVELEDGLLCRSRNRQLIQDAVTAYRANQRAGTAATKTKSTVIGTAVAGDASSPHVPDRWTTTRGSRRSGASSAR